MDIFLDISSGLCLLLGSFLCLSGGVGIIRFPDYYTRIHAVGVTDTLAAGMILVGLMLQNPDMIVMIKLMMILLMTLFINPTASHAIAKAAMDSGLMPLLEKKETGKKEKGKKEAAEGETPSNI